MILNKPGETFEYEGRKLMIGDQIVANGESEYDGLFGTITEIRDGEDKETENETPDLYCCFEEPATPYEIDVLEERFTNLCGTPKTIGEIALDLVIMAPEMVMTLKDAESQKIQIPIFVITEDWADNDDSGINVWFASDITSAKQKMKFAIKEAKKGGGIFDMRGEEGIEEDSSELSYEIYSEGYYCSSHYSIYIKEDVFTCSAEFIKNLADGALMNKKNNHEAKNLRPECDPSECFGCPYFDMDTAYCSVRKKIKGCKYCTNAFTDRRLDSKGDLSYFPIGRAEKGITAFIRSSAEYRPPVCIVVQKYREDIKQKVDIVHYTLAYCPVCGRQIIENKKFLQEE